MKRITIIGSSGAGKTWLAKHLSSILNIGVIHLDRVFLQVCWDSMPSDARINILKELVQQEQWIIEGTFLRSSGPRLKEADTIIFLDMPPWLCLLRIFYRHFWCRKQPRPDLLDGCSDHLNMRRILKVVFFRIRHHKELILKMQNYSLDKEIIWLRSPKEVENFLAELRQAANRQLAINTLHFLPSETPDHMIVDHPNSLHEGVADGGADEGEAESFQLFTHHV